MLPPSFSRKSIALPVWTFARILVPQGEGLVTLHPHTLMVSLSTEDGTNLQMYREDFREIVVAMLRVYYIKALNR